MSSTIRNLPQWRRAGHLALILLACTSGISSAQEPDPSEPVSARDRIETVGKVIAGGLLGLSIHEGGHLIFDGVFDASPGVKRVSYAGIPFFAITHEPVSARKEFVISSAGFWAQHVTNEVMLSRRPRLRHERAPLLKGMLAFNLLVSAMYAGAALATTGPDERDTRGLAASIDLAEPWVAPVVLAPAVLDGIRYFRPNSRTARWASRAAKVGSVLLIVRVKS